MPAQGMPAQGQRQPAHGQAQGPAQHGNGHGNGGRPGPDSARAADDDTASGISRARE
jgi:hypothetical protein